MGDAIDTDGGPMETRQAFKVVLKAIRHVGLGFHFDTDPADYIDLDTDAPTYSEEDADALREAISIIWPLVPEPYGWAMRVLHLS